MANKLEILLEKKEYLPNDCVTGQLMFDVNNRLMIRDLDLKLTGTEITEIYTGSTHKEINEVWATRMNLFEAVVKKRQNGVLFKRGVHMIDFSIQLPEKITPSYKGKKASVSYELKTRADIPLRIDLVDVSGITIQREPPPKKKQDEPEEERNKFYPIPYTSKDLEIQLILEKTAFNRGDNISGKVQITDRAKTHNSKLHLQLYSVERAVAKGYHNDTTLDTIKQVLDIPQEEDQISVSIDTRIPSDVVPTTFGENFNLKWYLSASIPPKPYKQKILSPSIRVPTPSVKTEITVQP